MKKLLLVALLIVGCEETTEPGPDVYGCTDATACNFDSTATIFDNSCWYTSIGCECSAGESASVDNCDVCDADTSNPLLATQA